MNPNVNEIENFSNIIFELVKKNNEDYIDTVVSYCEETGLEIEIAAKLLAPSIKQHIELQAKKHNLIQKESCLPI